MTSVQAQDEDEIKELQNQIRRDKFDQILPQIMREYDIDMWIHVMREGSPDFMGDELGSNNGVFIFTDRGDDRIERAVIGHRWRDSDLVREGGAYDIIAEEVSRIEMPGGPKTEFDHRFEGVGEFVANRDPKRIAVNYLEKLGPPVVYSVPRLRSDGISYTDYLLLTKELGDKYTKRLVSAEYLTYDYLSGLVPSEIVMFKKIHESIAVSLESDFAKIVPGVTKFSDLEGALSVVDKNGNRRTGGDYVLQGGDVIELWGGLQDHHILNPEWQFGNFYEVVIAHGYLLREGETEPPQMVKKAWADAQKARKILEDNIKVGRTAGETYKIIKQKLAEIGIIAIDRQQYNKDLDPEITQVPFDLHAGGKGVNAPRIGSYGPDWQRDMTLKLNHHFYFQYWVYLLMPEWSEGEYLSLEFHDGVILTEHGVEYFTPPPKEIRLIR